VAVSGAVDYITDGEEVVGVPGGHVSVDQGDRIGMRARAVMAHSWASPMPARRGDRRLAVFAAAGDGPRRKAQGPGGLAVGLLDELYGSVVPELVA